ncbi:SANT and BTB domain regulator of class switch recombination [Stomoxys calcitrans]|uniref:SANT and BTB domain-containing protein n=1 Tax=Stomoxys calcitrans TaxID=35570 RepID=A0A1I8PIX5_STOCA|nr:SANT and BTB domain regulator of class switch recombination [Stomoxys calcitrans]
MASNNNSQKPTTHNGVGPNDSAEKTINLNDFLDFLNLSCHVNDMISQTQTSQQTTNHHTKELHAHHHGSLHKNTTNGAGNSMPLGTKSSGPAKSLDFQHLAHNCLVNDLFGYKRASPQAVQEDLTDSGPSTGSSTGLGDTTARGRRLSSMALSKTKQAQTNTNGDGTLHPKLNEKLDNILNEGILDAVLPFICPVPLPANYNNRLKPKGTKEVAVRVSPSAPAVVAMQTCTESEGDASSTTTSKETSTSTRAPTKISSIPIKTSINSQGATSKKEPEVVIHVCDEVKNTSKDFICPQSLLVSKMGYFADVTAGQKLEDMDISVHCDIQIFDWLMKWVKSEGNNSLDQGDGSPNLNVNNVVPILVSASFLQMEPLLLDCLSFCHSRLGEVVKASTNLSCLNDSIITRMADMFTNVELEMVRDKKDRLVPRLWTKLIQSLCEPEPEALRGHYYSLAGLFRCSRCQRCLTNTMKSYVQCIQGNVRLNRWGQLVSHHVRDPTWDLNCYIAQLFKELKSWRRVYWKLWGHAHYLYCCLCEMYFPVYQLSWCRYHPETPSFLGPVADGRTTGAAGRYACCGQQAFRFETLPGPNGCQIREHSVLVETDRERSILSIVQLATEGHALGDSPPLKMQESLTSAEHEPRWMLLSLMPQRCRQGLLPVLNPDDANSRVARRVRPASSKFFADSSTETESTDNTLENLRSTSRKYGLGDYGSSFSTSSSDGCESSGSKAMAPKKNYSKKHHRKSKPPLNPGRYWSGELSARSNQDNQREFEEKVMKQVVALVRKKNGADINVTKPSRPLGGCYVKLEQEWKEQLKQRYYNLGPSVSNSQMSGNCAGSTSSLSIKASRKKGDNASGQ